MEWVEESVVQSQYSQFLRYICDNEHISLTMISQWCSIMFAKNEEGGAMLEATHRVLFDPWNSVASQALPPGRARWERAAARGKIWKYRDTILSKVWYHALRKRPRLFWQGVTTVHKEAVIRAVQDIEIGYAALLLPPLGRCAGVVDSTQRRRAAAKQTYRRVPASVWGVVAGFCVGTAADAVAWRGVAGGEWSLGLWHMGRARWADHAGPGLPGVCAVARLLGDWRAAVPRLLRLFECSVIMTHEATIWYRPALEAISLYCTPFNQIIWGKQGENKARNNAPPLRLAYTHAEQPHTQAMEALYLSPEDMGLPFTVRRYILDIIPPQQ